MLKSQTGIAHIALILILVAAVVAGTVLVQRRTNFLPHAQECPEGEDCGSDSGSNPPDNGNGDSNNDESNAGSNDNPSPVDDSQPAPSDTAPSDNPSPNDIPEPSTADDTPDQAPITNPSQGSPSILDNLITGLENQVISAGETFGLLNPETRYENEITDSGSEVKRIEEDIKTSLDNPDKKFLLALSYGLGKDATDDELFSAINKQGANHGYTVSGTSLSDFTLVVDSKDGIQIGNGARAMAQLALPCPAGVGVGCGPTRPGGMKPVELPGPSIGPGMTGTEPKNPLEQGLRPVPLASSDTGFVEPALPVDPDRGMRPGDCAIGGADAGTPCRTGAVTSSPVVVEPNDGLLKNGDPIDSYVENGSDGNKINVKLYNGKIPGLTVEEKDNGQIVVTFPNGYKVRTDSDGTEVRIKKDGNLESVSIPGYGRLTGSDAQITESGHVRFTDEENRIIRIFPDGSKNIRNPDGTTQKLGPDEDLATALKPGANITEVMKDSPIEDKSPSEPVPIMARPKFAEPVVEDLPGGGKVTTYADGSKIYVYPDGRKVVIDSRGIETEIIPNVSRTEYRPNGTEVSYTRDGREITTQSNGRQTTKYIDNTVIQDEPGGKVIYLPDHREIHVSDDEIKGGKLITRDDGVTVLNLSYGHNIEIRPDGTQRETHWERGVTDRTNNGYEYQNGQEVGWNPQYSYGGAERQITTRNGIESQVRQLDGSWKTETIDRLDNNGRWVRQRVSKSVPSKIAGISNKSAVLGVSTKLGDGTSWGLRPRLFSTVLQENSVADIGNKLRKDGQINIKEAKSIILGNANYPQSGFRTGDNMTVSTSLSGNVKFQAPRSMYEIKVKPMAGVDARFSSTVKVKPGTIITVGISEGTGQAISLKTSTPLFEIEDLYGAEDEPLIQVATYNDKNKNGKWDVGEDAIPWAGVTVELKDKNALLKKNDSVSFFDSIPFFKMQLGN